MERGDAALVDGDLERAAAWYDEAARRYDLVGLFRPVPLLHRALALYGLGRDDEGDAWVDERLRGRLEGVVGAEGTLWAFVDLIRVAGLPGDRFRERVEELYARGAEGPLWGDTRALVRDPALRRARAVPGRAVELSRLLRPTPGS